MTFDEGACRRDVGHESALSHGFVTSVRCAILHIARTQDRFTSEDVVAILPAATVDALAAFPNALGACIRAEALAGSIVATDVTRHATRPEARKRRLVVWRKGDL